MTSSYRILYVDDEPALLEVVRLYLEKKSKFSVETANSAAEALDKIESDPPYDAVISDYQMPVMNGIEFLKALRRRGNDIPFIIFTGKGREDVVIQALNEGADFYLQKGGDPASQFAELAHVVRKVVRERRVEASIRDMERREADILNFLPDATFAIDLHGTVIVWNRAMERMTGIPAERILGKGGYEYAVPFYNERRPILIDLVLRPDPATEAKYPYIRREGDVLVSEIFIPHLNDGRGAHLWFLASPLYNSRGNVVGAIETIRDVSEWKKLERESNERERFLSTLISNLPGFVYRCRNDREWTMEFISEGCREITGYTPSDFIGNATVSFNDVIVPTYRNLLWDMWQEVLRERKVFEYEYPIITRDGEVRWVWERGRGVFDAQGNLLYLEGFITDVTSRKKTEIAFRESEERFRLLAENARDIIFRYEISPKRGLSYVSPAVIPILGYTPEECYADPNIGYALVHPDDRHYIDAMLTLSEEVYNRPLELRWRKKDGQFAWLELHNRPVYDDAGNLVALEGIARDITERKRIERELAESEERLHDLFMHMGEGFALCQAIQDPGGRVTDWILVESNPAFERITGFSDIKGKRASEVHPGFGEKSPEILGAIERTVREGTPTELEVYVDVFRKWFRASVFSPQKGYFGAVFEDITPRKEAEEDLRRAVREWEVTFDGSSDAICLLDASQRIGRCNRAMETMFGTGECDSLSGRHCWEIVHGSNSPPPECPYVKMRKSLGKETMELNIGESWYQVTVDPILDEQGSLVGAVHNIRDITERKRIERELAESEEKYRALLENLPEQILVHRGGQILYANPAALRTFGYYPEDMTNRHIMEYIPPEYHTVITETIRKRDEGSQIEPYEIEVFAKDGARKTVRVSESQIVYGGQPATLVVIIDISERKRAEAALQQAHKKLALLGNITRHDINNQILVLSGILDLLETTGSAEEREALLARAREAISRIHATIRFARDCAQVGESAPRWLNLRGLVDAAAADTSTPTVTLENGIDPDLEVFADQMVGRVFANLLDNAIRHGGHVTKIQFSAAEEGDLLVVTYEDDGTGVPAEEKEKIFEKGYGKNTGMGLFLSREILSITGMSIREAGIPGEGARFIVTVPRGAWRRAPRGMGES